MTPPFKLYMLETHTFINVHMQEKLPGLSAIASERRDLNTGVGRMHSRVYSEIVTAITRQLSCMPYFEDGEDDDADEERTIVEEQMRWAPLTNLGCESKMAWLDNRIKVSGGSTSAQTLPEKSIIAHNKYLSSPDFDGLSEDRKLELWRFGRSGDTAKAVRRMYDDWHNQVSQAKVLAADGRKKIKIRKASRLLVNIQKCVGHGGPVSEKNVDILHRLNTDQLKLEIAVLKQTVSETIRSKYKVTVPGGRNYFQTFSDDILRSSIRAVVCPSSQVDKSVEALLLDIEPASEFIGRGVEKYFDGTRYTGTVTEAYECSNDGRVELLHIVVYDDGDVEDYNADELQAILSPAVQ